MTRNQYTPTERFRSLTALEIASYASNSKCDILSAKCRRMLTLSFVFHYVQQDLLYIVVQKHTWLYIYLYIYIYCITWRSNSVLVLIGLTHWGQVTHISVSKLTIICSDNGFSPDRRQAIIWTSARILLNGPLGIKFSDIVIEIHAFHSQKCIWRRRLMVVLMTAAPCLNKDLHINCYKK